MGCVQGWRGRRVVWTSTGAIYILTYSIHLYRQASGKPITHTSPNPPPQK